MEGAMGGERFICRWQFAPKTPSCRVGIRDCINEVLVDDRTSSELRGFLQTAAGENAARLFLDSHYKSRPFLPGRIA